MRVFGTLVLLKQKCLESPPSNASHPCSSQRHGQPKWLLRYSLTTKGNFPLLYRSQLYFILDLISYLWLILRGDGKSTEKGTLKYQELSISLRVLLWPHVWKAHLILRAAVYCLPHSIILDQENNIIDLKFPKFNQLWDTILV